ncbi:unnamed protein product [Rhizophagus irregularis]|nr:unnamed protein product [Rhizophagus irregularis]
MYIETSVSLSQQINASRLNINDNNLSEPKNFVYEQNDDIISVECLETSQINISQLSTNKDDKYEQNDDIISVECSETSQIDISQLSS